MQVDEGHVRCKKTIENEQIRLEDCIKRLITKSEASKENEKQTREKRKSVEEQVQSRYGVIVAMAAKYRDQALKELQEISDSIEKDLAAENQRIQEALDSVLHLQVRVSQALNRAPDTEVMQVEKDLTRGPGSAEWLRELEAGLPDTTYRPGLHGDFTNEVEEQIKRFIGSPVKLDFSSLSEPNVVRVGRCGDGDCNDVHALRQKEDKTVGVVYGGPGGNFSKETLVSFYPDGSKGKAVTRYSIRVSFVTRKQFFWKWEKPDERYFGSKGDRVLSIIQYCTAGTSFVRRMVIQSEQGKERCTIGTVLCEPKVHMIHNFDSSQLENLFVVIDEAKKSNDDFRSNDHEEMVKNTSRVVHLYSTTSDAPVATYTPPKQPFFPTDVCFYRDDLLLIADWMNDCVHVVKVNENKMTFIDYLPGSGDIIRPTALNLDLNGQLMIGCGDGWVLKFPFSERYSM